MNTKLINAATIENLARKAAGVDSPGGDPRTKTIVHRLLGDLFRAIDDLDIQPEEVWAAVSYLGEAAGSHELGLVVPGVALEHYLDLRQDEAERRAGLLGGTSRTIEGPLYIAGAPLSQGDARLDDGTEDAETVFVQGHVRDEAGKPVAGAIVDVWHANTLGNYSHFDPSQPAFNLRRRIQADENGVYRFRSIIPRGYGVPPDGAAQKLLSRLGRHGQRPAHIHFFVTANGYRQLTTQINLAGDRYLHDDFAFATRDDLIAEVVHHADVGEIHARGQNKPFATIDFDFTLTADKTGAKPGMVQRERATA